MNEDINTAGFFKEAFNQSLDSFRKSWELIREESAFVDWQRAKVQECADEVLLPSWQQASSFSIDVQLKTEEDFYG